MILGALSGNNKKYAPETNEHQTRPQGPEEETNNNNFRGGTCRAVSRVWELGVCRRGGMHFPIRSQAQHAEPSAFLKLETF